MTEQHLNQAAPTAINRMPERKAVNIIAMGSSPDMLKEAEIWTINYMGGQIRCDRIIHVDPVHSYLGHPIVRDMCEFALKDNIPFYTSTPHPKYSNHVVYPFDRVSASLGGITYFNTSVAYAIALAMADGFNEIGLFGCDFSYPDVHMAESGRACCEFLMGIGTQRGIRFAVAQSSTLLDMYCRQAPYGWFADPNLPPNNGGRLMTAQEIMQHIHKIRNPPQISDKIITIKVGSPSVVEPFIAPVNAYVHGGQTAASDTLIAGANTPLGYGNGKAVA